MRIERSEDFLSPAQIISTRESLQKAEAANAKISDLRQGILSDEEKDRFKAQIEEAETGLKSLLEPLQPTSDTSADQLLQVQENACRELECVVCIEIPTRTIQNFSCAEHHLLCTDCKNNPSITKCPVCRQDFERIPVQRNRLAEKMVAKLT